MFENPLINKAVKIVTAIGDEREGWQWHEFKNNN